MTATFRARSTVLVILAAGVLLGCGSDAETSQVQETPSQSTVAAESSRQTTSVNSLVGTWRTDNFLGSRAFFEFAPDGTARLHRLASGAYRRDQFRYERVSTGGQHRFQFLNRDESGQYRVSQRVIVVPLGQEALILMLADPQVAWPASSGGAGEGWSALTVRRVH